MCVECHFTFLSSFVLQVQREENCVSGTALDPVWEESNFQPYPSVLNLVERNLST